MGLKKGMGEKMRERLRGSKAAARKRKAAFYLFFGVAAFLVILILITVSYVGTPVPFDLLRLNNFTFSYSGSPTYTYIFSENFFTGLNGVGGTDTVLNAGEGSRLTIQPSGDVGVIYRNGTRAKGQKPFLITVPPGENAKVTIRVVNESNTNFNMRLAFNNSTITPLETNYSIDNVFREFNRNNATLQIIRETVDRYNILSYYLPGAIKTFEVIDEPFRSFPIQINFSPASDGQDRIGRSDVESIVYSGKINVSTGNALNIKSSVSRFSEISCFAIKLKNARGVLDIKHLNRDSNAADTIAISKGDLDINASLRCGEILVTGSAKELMFRDKEFQWPVWVIIKEGNFALLTTLLSSFMTIMLARFISTMKKK